MPRVARVLLRGTAGWLAVLLVAAAVFSSAAAPPSAEAQRVLPAVEDRMLRQASAQEARGDLKGAEATLLELLKLRPSASSAVFALERIYRTADRLASLLPVADTFLAANVEGDPVRALKLRVLVESDSLSALEEAVGDWIRASPASSAPYLEGARVYLDALGPEPAADLVGDGLERLGEQPELMVLLGDVYMSAGRIGAAAAAWAGALGRDRARTAEVIRRLDALEAEQAETVAGVVAALAERPTTASRLEAGAVIALRHGLADEARALAEGALEEFSGREARGFLAGIARRAEDLGSHDVALWAYFRLQNTDLDPAEAQSNDKRIVRTALMAGDTTSALAAQVRVRDAQPSGSALRQEAWTEELRLRVLVDSAAAAQEALAAFRDEFPDALELDELSAALAFRLMRSGQREAAAEVLAGIEGPGAALERAYLLLEAGAIAEGAAALRASITDLAPSEATEVLALSLALSRISPLGTRLLAGAAVASRRGNSSAAVASIRGRISDIPDEDRAAVLAAGARIADAAGLSAEATEFRRQIVADYSEAPEFPEAALRLASAIVLQPGGSEEAAKILEDLIVAHPTSPVVPGARRALSRIRGNGS